MRPRDQTLCHMYLCIIFGGVCGLPRPIFLSLENAPTLVIASDDLVEQYCGAPRHVMGGVRRCPFSWTRRKVAQEKQPW